MNKKGNVGVMVLLFIVLFIILFAGIIMVVGSSVMNYVGDIFVPEFKSIGSAGPVNFTEIADYSLVPLNKVVQSFTWITGLLYVMMLFGVLGMAFMMRGTMNVWLMGLFVLFVVMLIFASIFISNMYENIYNGTDDLASVVREHTLLSFFVLYSPEIMTIISFIAGAILFSGAGGEEYAYV